MQKELESNFQEEEPSDYVSGPEGLEILRKAGIEWSKNSYYKELPKMPGIIRLGKKFYVPRDIVSRLANQ